MTCPIDAMSIQSSRSSDPSFASFDRFTKGLARGLGIASTGNGTVLHEFIAIATSNSRCSADTLLIRHPLVFSDICDVSSKHLWLLHERLLTMLVAHHKEEAPMEAHLVTATRLDTWILIDLVVKERLESRMAEPPSDAGFHFEGENRDDFFANYSHGLQTRVRQSHDSSKLFSKDALQRSRRDTITLQKRKQAHFLQLAECNSGSDSDLEIGLSPARRLHLLSKREDRRMARLIRDCPQPSTFTGKRLSTDAAAPMTDFIMSGALSPHPPGYLVADNTAFSDQHGQDNAKEEKQPDLVIPTPLPPNLQHRTTPSEIPKEGQKTALKPPKRITRASLRDFSSRMLLRSKASHFSSHLLRK